MNHIEHLFAAGDFSRETGFKEKLGRTLFGKSSSAQKLSEAEASLINAACALTFPERSSGR